MIINLLMVYTSLYIGGKGILQLEEFKYSVYRLILEEKEKYPRWYFERVLTESKTMRKAKWPQIFYESSLSWKDREEE